MLQDSGAMPPAVGIPSDAGTPDTASSTDGNNWSVSPIWMTYWRAAVLGGDALSVKRIVNVNRPVAVGVPKIRPLSKPSERPVGSTPPATLHEPVTFATNCCTYA